MKWWISRISFYDTSQHPGTAFWRISFHNDYIIFMVDHVRWSGLQTGNSPTPCLVSRAQWAPGQKSSNGWNSEALMLFAGWWYDVLRCLGKQKSNGRRGSAGLLKVRLQLVADFLDHPTPASVRMVTATLWNLKVNSWQNLCKAWAVSPDRPASVRTLILTCLCDYHIFIPHSMMVFTDISSSAAPGTPHCSGTSEPHLPAGFVGGVGGSLVPWTHKINDGTGAEIFRKWSNIKATLGSAETSVLIVYHRRHFWVRSCHLIDPFVNRSQQKANPAKAGYPFVSQPRWHPKWKQALKHLSHVPTWLQVWQGSA